MSQPPNGPEEPHLERRWSERRSTWPAPAPRRDPAPPSTAAACIKCCQVSGAAGHPHPASCGSSFALFPPLPTQAMTPGQRSSVNEANIVNDAVHHSWGELFPETQKELYQPLRNSHDSATTLRCSFPFQLWQLGSSEPSIHLITQPYLFPSAHRVRLMWKFFLHKCRRLAFEKINTLRDILYYYACLHLPLVSFLSPPK